MHTTVDERVQLDAKSTTANIHTRLQYDHLHLNEGRMTMRLPPIQDGMMMMEEKCAGGQCDMRDEL
jgi:hypothetical protein